MDRASKHSALVRIHYQLIGQFEPNKEKLISLYFPDKKTSESEPSASQAASTSAAQATSEKKQVA